MALQERRTLIGKRNGVSSRRTIYRTADAIEIDEVEGYDVTRRRVFFDDIVLVTYHRFLGWPFLIFTGLLLVFALLLTAMSFLNGGGRAALLMFALFALPCLIALVLRLVLRVDAVTVYGKRTKAQIPFWFRKAQARELYQQIGRLAREHQDRLAREVAAAAPPRWAPPGPGPGGPA